ncbi:phospholipase A2 [Streptosporangium amethystogenes subsp. fukuiense]|uniref:Phospholipase A2 n=1 Tax=Streptosporangium amethystogenes subsp. fukuiense TaxID=698418 RepID=A0ABW2T2G8_9ACTN
MRDPVKKGVLALITTLALATGGPAAASAEISSAGVYEDARHIMGLNYPDFERHPRVAPFDWSTDGCTGIGQFFRRACVIHDFGYRNFGNHGALKLSPFPATKEWIDERFWHEMRRICFDTYGPSGGATQGCLGGAYTAYKYVRDHGGEHFF